MFVCFFFFAVRQRQWEVHIHSCEQRRQTYERKKTHTTLHWVDSLRARFSDYEVGFLYPRGNGCAALLIFSTARTFPSIFGYGTALAVTLAAFEYTGGSLWGKDKDQNLDKYEQLEKLRKNYRTPGEQTIAELGEGRGMYRHLCADICYTIIFPQF